VVGGEPEMVGAIGEGVTGTGAEAGCAALVPEFRPCDTPTTSQALSPRSATTHAVKPETSRTRREFSVLLNSIHPCFASTRRFIV
jgi:hypothetical protein